MPIKKDYQIIELKSRKLKISVVLLIVLACAFLIRLTPLIDNIWINYISAFIVSDSISIIVIASLLMALHLVELKRYKELLKEEEDNVY